MSGPQPFDNFGALQAKDGEKPPVGPSTRRYHNALDSTLHRNHRPIHLTVRGWSIRFKDGCCDVFHTIDGGMGASLLVKEAKGGGIVADCGVFAGRRSRRSSESVGNIRPPVKHGRP